MNQRSLLGLSWQQYLVLLFALLGTGLFASGVVSFIAANWDYLSKFQKIYATQGLFVLISLGSLLFYWREAGQTESHFKSKTGLFVAAVLIGVLFALIGQIYQTGADSWQLFALWSLLQLPLLLALPNVANATLWIVTANLALGLYLNVDVSYYSKTSMMLLTSFNAVLLLLVEWQIKRLQDKWRILPKFLAFLITLAAWLGMLSANSFLGYELGYNSLSGLFLNVIVVFGLFWIYRSIRQDIGIVAIAYIYAIVSIDTWILMNGSSIATLLIVAIISFVAALIGAEWLKKWYVANYPNRKLPLSIYGIAFILACIAVVCFILFLLLSSGSEITLLVVAIALLLIGSVQYFSHNTSRHTAEMLILFGLLLTLAYAVSQQVFYQSNPNLFFLLPAGIALLCYVVFKVEWLRIVCVNIILFSAFYYLNNDTATATPAASNISLVRYLYDAVYFATFVLAIYTYKKPESAVKFQSILWGLVIYHLILMAQMFSNLYVYLQHSGNAEMKTVDSLTALFNVLTNNMFAESDLSISLLLIALYTLVPIVMYIFISRPFKYRLLFAIPITLFPLLFIASGGTVTLFGLLLMSYILRSRVLFAILIIYMIANLGLYYYWLDIPLLYKSMLLIATSLLFLLVLAIYKLLEYRNANSSRKTTALLPLPKWNGVTLSVLAGMLATLVMANYVVTDNEDVLNNGKPLILKVAPLDPRSLMQGDYMELNYEILDAAQRQFYENIEEPQGTMPLVTSYLLLKTNELGISELCRIESQRPQDFSGCAEGIYLPMKYREYGLTIPGQNYFFAEGKADYYAQAEYAEYRFKDGKVLLLRLLDGQLKPL